jgi:gamma-glutamyltranspeptidase
VNEIALHPQKRYVPIVRNAVKGTIGTSTMLLPPPPSAGALIVFASHVINPLMASLRVTEPSVAVSHVMIEATKLALGRATQLVSCVR